MKPKLFVNLSTPIEIVTLYKDYEEDTGFLETLEEEVSGLIANRSSAIEEWVIFDGFESSKNVKCECECLEFSLDSIEIDLSAIDLVAKISIESDKEIEDLASLVSSNLERFCVDSLDAISYTYSYSEFDEYDVSISFKESNVTVKKN